MNKRTYVIVVPLLLLAAGLLVGCIRGVTGDSLSPEAEQNGNSDTHLPTNPHLIEDDHVTVDPRLLELLEESEWVRVGIAIPMPPGFEWAEGPHDDAYIENVRTTDWDLFDQLRAERKAHIAAWLGSDLEQRLPGQWINAAGVEKMRNHPFVRGIGPYGIDSEASYY